MEQGAKANILLGAGTVAVVATVGLTVFLGVGGIGGNGGGNGSVQSAQAERDSDPDIPDTSRYDPLAPPEDEPRYASVEEVRYPSGEWIVLPSISVDGADPMSVAVAVDDWCTSTWQGESVVSSELLYQQIEHNGDADDVVVVYRLLISDGVHRGIVYRKPIGGEADIHETAEVWDVSGNRYNAETGEAI